MGALSTYLAGRSAGGQVELQTGLVIAWSAGDRRVSILGNEVPDVSYAADAVGSIAPGDTVAVLVTGGSHLVLCKVATA